MKQRNSMKEHKNHHRCPHLGKNVSLRPTVLIYPSSYHLSTYRKQTKINFGRILLKQWNRNIVTPWMVTLIVSWATVIEKQYTELSSGEVQYQGSYLNLTNFICSVISLGVYQHFRNTASLLNITFIYLTGVATAKLWRCLSNKNVIHNI